MKIYIRLFLTLFIFLLLVIYFATAKTIRKYNNYGWIINNNFKRLLSENKNKTKNWIANIIKTSDGYIIFGSIKNNNKFYYGWIYKINRKGNTIFNRIYFYNKNNSDNYIYQLRQIPNGYICVGETGNNDITYGWILKIDNLGRIILSRKYRYKENKDNILYSIVKILNGYIAVGTTGDIDISTYGWILTIDKKGKVKINKIYSYKNKFYNYNGINKIIKTNDGYINIGSTQVGIEYGSYNRAWILKLDKKQKIKFNKIYYYKENTDNYISNIIETSDGKFLTVGSTQKSDNTRQYGWILKLNKNGSIYFNKIYSYKNNNYNLIFNIIKISKKEYIGVGETKKTANSKQYGWIIKLDKEGNIKDNFNKIYSYKKNRYNFIFNVINTIKGYLVIANTGNDNNKLGWIFKIDKKGDIQ